MEVMNQFWGRSNYNCYSNLANLKSSHSYTKNGLKVVLAIHVVQICKIKYIPVF